VGSFLRLFAGHKGRLKKTMAMLKRESAPWKALLTREDAERLRKWLS
jgi:hypothetical protein